MGSKVILKKNSKKQKFFLNKSYFSVDKLKLKKASSKKNQSKNYVIIKRESNYNNATIKMKTTINQVNKSENVKQNFSLNNINRKKSLSFNSINLNKKKKLKIKSKSKILTYKSTNDLGKSNSEVKSDLYINEIYSNNDSNEFKNNNFINMDKKCNYTIRRYINNKQVVFDENVFNNEEENDISITPTKTVNVSKKNMPMYFSVYHFFDTDNLYFFIPNSKFEEIKLNLINTQTISNLEEDIKKYEILENFYLPPAFRPRMNKWKEMPECITDTCKKGGFALIKNFDNCNLIWRLVHPNKMKGIIRNIHNNQKYNHFISTFHLGRKDNLYKHFKYYKKLFPDMFNYAPATYILPVDGPDFEIDYKKNRKALWIVKPTNLSRGRGVHLLKGEREFKELYKKSTQFSLPQYLISRYIDKPHLLNNKKYDLRLYVLVASFTPLRIYLYNNGLVRFATEDYKRGDLNNVFIHLTNYSINKNNLKYKPNQNITNYEWHKSKNTMGGEENEENDEYEEECEFEEDYSKWSLFELRHYFKKIGKEKIMDKIWKQVQDIVIKTVLSVADDYYKEVSLNKINSLFELYGFDIMIDEKFKAWLIEVNVNPSLHCSSPLDLNLKTDLIGDILNVVGISPYNHNNNGEVVYNYLMKKTKLDFDLNNELFPKLRFTRNNFFDLYDDFENYVNNNKNINLANNITMNNNIMTIKSNIIKNFNPLNLKQKLPEYDNEYYKNIIEYFKEERARSEMTDFKLIFPLKNNIEFYKDIMIKSNTLNDSNIVLWQHILN
jgi:tubulin polyglutamylase TTLL4